MTTESTKSSLKKESITQEDRLQTLDHQISELEATINQLQSDYNKKNEQMGSCKATSMICIEMSRSLSEMTAKMKAYKDERAKLYTTYFDQIETIRKENLVEDGNNDTQPSKETDSEFEIKTCEGGCRDFVIDVRQEVMRCEKCGHERSVEVEEYRLNHGDYDGVQMRPKKNGYTPDGHFQEVIINFQGKRATWVNRDVLTKVGALCDQFNIPAHARTPEVAMFCLKLLQQEVVHIVRADAKNPIAKSKFRHYTEYYKQCPEIAQELSGITPPIMTPMQEDIIKTMYQLAVVAYETSPRFLRKLREKKNRLASGGPEYKKAKKRLKPNNMNCHYLLYKICHLLGYTSFLGHIKLPKNPDNIDDCDENGWKHICGVYGWAYMPTR